MNHIALICDDNYVLPTKVVIKSITSNNNFKCHIHVCTFGLNALNQKKLLELSTNDAIVSIDVFKNDTIEAKLVNVRQQSHVTPTALIKLELANYFSKIDKMLYLDSDILVLRDISQLFDLAVDDYYLAASFEFWNYLNSLRYNFGKKEVDFYFNSGVMLLNLKKFRQENIPEKLWDYKLNKSKTTLMDQECLNAVCGKKVYPLSIGYNCNPIFMKEEYLKSINSVYHVSFSSIEEFHNEVAIFHYVGKHDKPWIYSNANMQSEWQNYYNLLKDPERLNLISYTPEKIPFFKKIKNTISKFGLRGLASYFFFRRSK